MKVFNHKFVLLFLYLALKCNAASEPACSKFDYEEKLLAKTIRLENTVDDVVKTLKEVQTGLSECENQRKEMGLQLETLRNVVETQNATTMETMMQLEDKVSALSIQMNETEKQSPPRPKKCPSHYVYNAELNMCWRLEKDKKMDSLAANWDCYNEGGHLIILDSMAKIKFMQYYLVSESSVINEVHIGATDVMEKGKFKWINGQPVGTVPWSSGEPSAGSSERCIAMVGPNKQFYDRSCDYKYYFLCQIDL